MDKIYILKINDGLGRFTEIGAFTSIEKLQSFQIENPISSYESWEIEEFKIIG